MKVSQGILSLCIVHHCHAGFLVPIIASVAGAMAPAVLGAADAAIASVLTSSMATAFGVGQCSVWFTGAIIVNGAAYVGSNVVGVGLLAGGVAGGVGAGVASAVIDEQKSKDNLEAISKASVASVALASKASVSAASRESRVSKESAAGAASAKASVEAEAAAALIYDEALDPFTFGRRGLAPRTTASVGSAAASPPSTIPPPPGTPISTIPPAQRPSEVPPGVPEYNFRMCQYAIIQMGLDGASLEFDQPEAQSIRVNKVPPTCMVLATVLIGHPDLGPFPVPMGADSLQWNDIHPDTVDLVRIAFGQPPMDPNSSTNATLNRVIGRSVPEFRI